METEVVDFPLWWQVWQIAMSTGWATILALLWYYRSYFWIGKLRMGPP